MAKRGPRPNHRGISRQDKSQIINHASLNRNQLARCVFSIDNDLLGKFKKKCKKLDVAAGERIVLLVHYDCNNKIPESEITVSPSA